MCCQFEWGGWIALEGADAGLANLKAKRMS